MPDFKFKICSKITMTNELMAIAEVTSFILNENLEKLLGKDLTFRVLFKTIDDRMINKLQEYHGVLWDNEPHLNVQKSSILVFQIKFENLDYLAKFMEDFRS